ncbi:hypothetical protein COV20_01090 [Candidatus Woesearchaeota archaeon CG10_big_fil_rev_8_21_14_0_10_45_16]|nr:MAG: hypothetical protein COV20_01090 [Candidatus Woesearchaeota archaeon CG10_big_fil_rev_8_21_14_0_10_45_16]
MTLKHLLGLDTTSLTEQEVYHMLERAAENHLQRDFQYLAAGRLVPTNTSTMRRKRAKLS